MKYGLTNDTAFQVRPIRIFFSPNLSGTITCRPVVGLNSLKPVKFLSPAPHERSLSVMRYGLTNDTVFQVRPIRIFFSPNLSGTITCRPAVGLNSLKPLKFLSPAPHERSLSVMRYGLTNDTVFQVRPIRIFFSPNLSGTITCRPAVGLNSLKPLKFLSPAPHEHSPSVMRYGLPNDTAFQVRPIRIFFSPNLSGTITCRPAVGLNSLKPVKFLSPAPHERSLSVMRYGLTNDTVFQVRPIRIFFSPNLSGTITCRPAVGLNSLKPLKFLSPAPHERSLSVMRYGLTNDTVFQVRPIRIFFSPNLSGTITCRPAVGLNSLKPLKFLSPAPHEHSPSVMRYGLTNDTVFQVRPIRIFFSPNLSGTITCRPAVGLNSLKPVKFLRPAPHEHSPSVMRYGLTNDTAFQVRPIRIFFSPNLSGTITCRPVVGLNSLKPVKFLSPAPHERSLSVMRYGLTNDTVFQVRPIRIFFSPNLSGTITCRPAVGLNSLKPLKFLSPAQHERSLSVMRYGLTNDTVFQVRPIRIFFSPNLSSTITCRPAVGLNSLKPLKFLSPAPHEHSPSVMRYGLPNDTVFQVRPIRIFFSPNLSGTITCRPAVGLNSLKPLKFLSPAPHEHSPSVMRYGLPNDTAFQVSPIRIFFSPNLSGTITCRNVVGLNSLKPVTKSCPT